VSLETAVGRAATSQFLDIWLHTLDTKTTTHLAHLSGRYATLSFDLTPDGKRIVFDRVNDNSDIVLIDLPR
jgi:Tol biopolymer transport system component